MKTTTMEVPVSHPAHPAHKDWLHIIMTSLTLATMIGPAVVEIVDPQDAALANKLGQVAAAAESAVPVGA